MGRGKRNHKAFEGHESILHVEMSHGCHGCDCPGDNPAPAWALLLCHVSSPAPELHHSPPQPGLPRHFSKLHLHFMHCYLEHLSREKKKKKEKKQTNKGGEKYKTSSFIIRSITPLLLNKAEEPSQLPEGERLLTFTTKTIRHQQAGSSPKQPP